MKPPPETANRTRQEEIRSALESGYRAYQYSFVEFFIEHLSDLSRHFKGDLHAMVVLALVGQVYIRGVQVAVRGGYDPLDIPVERLGINASRIADVTGIPRQTVRRKLEALEKRGWITRNQEGAYRLSVKDGVAQARLDLSEIDKRSLVRVAKMFSDLEKIVRANPS